MIASVENAIARYPTFHLFTAISYLYNLFYQSLTIQFSTNRIINQLKLLKQPIIPTLRKIILLFPKYNITNQTKMRIS